MGVLVLNREGAKMSKVIGTLNIDNGIREIAIGDTGETISFSINDVKLIENFAGFMTWLEEAEDKAGRFTEKLKEKYPQGEKEDIDLDAIGEITQMRTELCREACGKLDTILGEGSCKKVFGDIIPDEEAIVEFAKQLMPILSIAFKERRQNISQKYNGNRKGARSRKRQRSKEELMRDYQRKEYRKRMNEK